MKKIKEIIRTHHFNSTEINTTYYYVVCNVEENFFFSYGHWYDG